MARLEFAFFCQNSRYVNFVAAKTAVLTDNTGVPLQKQDTSASVHFISAQYPFQQAGYRLYPHTASATAYTEYRRGWRG